MKYMMETSVMSIQKKSGKNLRRLKYYWEIDIQMWNTTQKIKLKHNEHRYM
jgi:hypothetical protein